MGKGDQVCRHQGGLMRGQPNIYSTGAMDIASRRCRFCSRYTGLTAMSLRPVCLQ